MNHVLKHNVPIIHIEVDAPSLSGPKEADVSGEHPLGDTGSLALYIETRHKGGKGKGAPTGVYIDNVLPVY